MQLACDATAKRLDCQLHWVGDWKLGCAHCRDSVQLDLVKLLKMTKIAKHIIMSQNYIKLRII